MKIGWIGTGVMGAPMVGHLLDAGHEMTVHTRTKERAEEVLDKGAAWAEEPAAVADGAEAVVTMLGYPADVRDTILGDGGLLEALEPGTLLVDHTTSEPSLAEEIAEAAAAKDVPALDGPVSGGDVGARNGKLVIMCGGEEEAFDRAKPLLEAYGATIVLHGGPGAGQHTKMVNQIAISSGMVALCEAMLYAYKSGLDVEQVLDTIGGGAAASFSLQTYEPRLL
jgi:3-hydroxyisobutyrate dehydrogenase